MIVLDNSELVFKDENFNSVRRVDSGRGITGAVAKSGETALATDTLADDTYDAQVDGMASEYLQSLLVVVSTRLRACDRDTRDDTRHPCFQHAPPPHPANVYARTPLRQPVRNANEKVVALLQCVNKLEAGVEPYEPSERPCFDEADSAYLEHVSSLISLAVKNATTKMNAEQDLDRSRALFEISHELTAQPTLKAVMQTVRKRCNKLFECQRATLFKVSAQSHSFRAWGVGG